MTYSSAEAADRIAADVAFVERAIRQGSVGANPSGRLSEADVETLRALYVSSGQALRDLVASAVEEGWYDTNVQRLRELGVVREECPEAESDNATGAT